MEARNENFIFGLQYNILNDTPLVAQPSLSASSLPPVSKYLITQNGNNLITQNGNNLIAN